MIVSVFFQNLIISWCGARTLFSDPVSHQFHQFLHAKLLGVSQLKELQKSSPDLQT